MDIIAGLPGENAADFERTLDAVFGLGPDGVTSHTLCIKRSSRFNESEGAYAYPDAGETESMQEAAFRRAASCGMRPYYLYRQKNTIGALANTGYARRGCECAYNIHEMADRIDVLAAGAGAVSKFVYPDGGRIERVFNVKNLLEYISRIDEMIRRKTVFFAASAMFSVEWK
jgi:oxygen-independent coproporphyrinogen-3 oxidase